MPTISRFFGIQIRMYYAEHGRPHFHAIYGEDEAVFSIQELELLRGELPRRATALVLEWAMIHRPEIRRNWDLARRYEPLAEIPGLDEES